MKELESNAEKNRLEMEVQHQNEVVALKEQYDRELSHKMQVQSELNQKENEKKINLMQEQTSIII